MLGTPPHQPCGVWSVVLPPVSNGYNTTKGCRSLGYRFVHDEVVDNAAYHPDLRSRLSSAGSQLPYWEIKLEAAAAPILSDSGAELRYHDRVAEPSSATIMDIVSETTIKESCAWCSGFGPGSCVPSRRSSQEGYTLRFLGCEVSLERSPRRLREFLLV